MKVPCKTILCGFVHKDVGEALFGGEHNYLVSRVVDFVDFIHSVCVRGGYDRLLRKLRI